MKSKTPSRRTYVNDMVPGRQGKVGNGFASPAWKGELLSLLFTPYPFPAIKRLPKAGRQPVTVFAAILAIADHIALLL